jgi:hypothetical protein
MRLREATVCDGYVSLGARRTNSPHEFYRYPARFSPAFARAAIDTFSRVGDLVVDPFVGGGTTLVESMLAGRPAIGADINPLAIFVSEVKTRLLSNDELQEVRRWVLSLPRVLNIKNAAYGLEPWSEGGYLKDLTDEGTWRIRHLIALALDSISWLPAASEALARCIVLRTGQWALDMRRKIPESSHFRSAMIEQGHEMIEIARAFRSEVCSPAAVVAAESPGLADQPEMAGAAARLVLTSPPYPGVYVNYHRWKLHGRREIRAPYWIANRLDGHGISRYTMHARATANLDTYFRLLLAAFQDVARYCDGDTKVVQAVGFNNPENQLDRYLETMHKAGFSEMLCSELATAEDGRLWRDVPHRRWWTKTSTTSAVTAGTSREVVLIHRLGR